MGAVPLLDVRGLRFPCWSTEGSCSTLKTAGGAMIERRVETDRGTVATGDSRSTGGAVGGALVARGLAACESAEAAGGGGGGGGDGGAGPPEKG